ncbi:MAG: hypothetical protein IIZ88_05745 [Prevotella sp.]|nr:hypothetical protein [Prevotella sp.]
MNEDREKFVPMGTKISPEMAEVWNAVCDSLGTDTYHMLQAFIYAMVRAASPQHALTPEIQKLMTYLETDVAWQNAINLCAPNGKLNIEQMVLILSQEGKKGFGMVMLNKPFMKEVQQTECVDDIVERVVEVGVKGIYRRLRQLGIYLQTESIIDTLITMADAQTIAEFHRENSEDMRGPANYHDYLGPIAYGKRTKRKHHKSVDMYDRQPTLFDKKRPYGEQADDYLRNLEERARQEEIGEMEDNMGFKPFDQEW